MSDMRTPEERVHRYLQRACLVLGEGALPTQMQTVIVAQMLQTEGRDVAPTDADRIITPGLAAWEWERCSQKDAGMSVDGQSAGDDLVRALAQCQVQNKEQVGRSYAAGWQACRQEAVRLVDRRARDFGGDGKEELEAIAIAISALQPIA